MGDFLVWKKGMNIVVGILLLFWVLLLLLFAATSIVQNHMYIGGAILLLLTLPFIPFFRKKMDKTVKVPVFVYFAFSFLAAALNIGSWDHDSVSSPSLAKSDTKSLEPQISLDLSKYRVESKSEVPNREKLTVNITYAFSDKIPRSELKAAAKAFVKDEGDQFKRAYVNFKVAPMHYMYSAFSVVEIANGIVTKFVFNADALPKRYCRGDALIWSPIVASCLSIPNEEDKSKAENVFKDYLKAENSKAQQLYEFDAHKTPGERLPSLKKAGHLGHYEAISLLGRLYREGATGIVANQSKAQYWERRRVPILKKKLADGQVSAALELADYYQFGFGGKENPRMALSYVRKAAKAGSDKGLFELGMAYKNGDLGLRKNPVKAKKYFILAKKAGNKLADIHLQ